MKRRTFMQMAGAASLGALSSRCATVASTTIAKTAAGEGIPMGDVPIRKEWLAGRNQNRSTVACCHGIVCTSQPLASMAGVDMLKAGGNAFDAAVCASAMMSLVEPMSCGPGGDLFAIVWVEKERKLFGLNASGRAPYDWSLNAATALGLTQIPSQGPLAWSVPGCVSGWAALLDRFGSKSFADALAPVIDCAREGFPVSPIIARSWPFPAEYETLARTYMPGGKAPAFGDIFTNPALADTFAQIAEGGADAFYKGAIADRMVKFSQSAGGRFSKRDFEDHTADWVEPIGANYRGFDVWEIPPNGQGLSALQILNILENFDIASLDPNSAEHLHLFIEAKKLAYEDRAVYYADPAFADVPVAQLLSKDYARDRASRIDPRRASVAVKPGRLDGSSDTIYLTAADKDGNMVSLIQSIYSGWGSHLVPDNLGFALQNRGSAFALDPRHRNSLQPHKRPFHTIIPAFVTRGGHPVFSFGVMGGDFQPQGHVQILMNIIDFGMSVQQAGDQPRVGHDGSSDPDGSVIKAGGSVGCERHIDEAVRQQLAGMGHEVRGGFKEFGGYQGIWRAENPLRWFGGSDPRKDGCAIGY